MPFSDMGEETNPKRVYANRVDGDCGHHRHPGSPADADAVEGKAEGARDFVPG